MHPAQPCTNAALLGLWWTTAPYIFGYLNDAEGSSTPLVNRERVARPGARENDRVKRLDCTSTDSADGSTS